MKTTLPATQAAKPSTRPGYLQWYHVYFLLAAFDLFAVSCGLYLTHRLVKQHKNTIEVNLQWVARITQADVLAKDAGEVATDSGDAYQTLEVEAEAFEMQESFSSFEKILAALRDDIQHNVPLQDRSVLLKDCLAVEKQMRKLVLRTDATFSSVHEGNLEAAATKVAEASRDYEEVLQALTQLRVDLRAFRHAYLLSQLAESERLVQFEWLLGALIALMVAGTIVYGVRLQRHMASSSAGLLESEEKYRNLFQKMREGFALCEIICDPAGKPCDFRYLEINTAFEEIIGIKPSAIIGKTAREAFPQIEEYWIETYGKVALTGEPLHFEDYFSPLNRHFEVTAFSPKPGQFASIFADVTKRKRDEEVLRQTNRRLEEALANLNAAQQKLVQQERLRALGTMASGVAHDFNNALAAILGFTELLLHKPDLLDDKETTHRYIEMMNVAAKDAGQVVNRLREFYRHRVESDVLLPLDLNRLIQDAVSLTEPKWKAEAEANGKSIVVKTDLQKIPEVIGNASELREVLTNLILNAVDAMPRGGTITIHTCRDDGHVVLEVSDTGTGMTEEVRRRCLEPFFSTKGDRGTGLGLSMVYGIVDRQGGSIDISSKVGKGTTLIIRLPHRETESEPSPRRPEPESRPENSAQSLHVLIVDDEAVVRTIVSEYLLIDGHQVVMAAGGREGLDKFRSGKFDLVMVDRSMPDLDGDQVAKAIKAADPSVPVIMLTGFGGMMDGIEKPPGVDFIVGKPVTIVGLRAVLADVAALKTAETHSFSTVGASS